MSEPRQRFKVGDAIDVQRLSGRTPFRVVIDAITGDGAIQGTEWEGGDKYTRVVLPKELGGVSLVHRENWIDPDEWWSGYSTSDDIDTSMLRESYNFRTAEILAFGYFLALLTSCPVSGWGSKREELVAVMLPRSSVEFWSEHLDDFRGSAQPVLHTACRAALED